MEILNSEIKSVIIKNNNIKSCTIFFLFNVGSINENDNNNGISHFIEHMVFKGNKTIKKSKTLLQKLDSLGADYNAFTTNNLTGYHIKIMEDYQMDAFRILYDMLFNSSFKQEEIDVEREVIKEEYLKDKNDQNSILEELTMQSVLKGTPYQRSIIGTIQSINNIKRKDILEYWKKYYTLNNCVLVVNGNIKKELINEIKKIKVNKTKACFNFTSNLPLSKPKKIIMKKDDSNQTNLSVAFKTFGIINQEKYTLDVISNILGGNMSSKLFLSLREEYGLVYDIDCENTFFKDEGYMQITCSFDNSNLIKTIDIIFDTIKLLKDTYVTDYEIHSNIKYLNSMELLSKEDTISFCEDIATEYILTDKLIKTEENILKYNKVDKYKIKNLSNQIFQKDNTHIIIIGNYDYGEIKENLDHNLSTL